MAAPIVVGLLSACFFFSTADLFRCADPAAVSFRPKGGGRSSTPAVGRITAPFWFPLAARQRHRAMCRGWNFGFPFSCPQNQTTRCGPENYTFWGFPEFRKHQLFLEIRMFERHVVLRPKRVDSYPPAPFGRQVVEQLHVSGKTLHVLGMSVFVPNSSPLEKAQRKNGNNNTGPPQKTPSTIGIAGMSKGLGGDIGPYSICNTVSQGFITTIRLTSVCPRRTDTSTPKQVKMCCVA